MSGHKAGKEVEALRRRSYINPEGVFCDTVRYSLDCELPSERSYPRCGILLQRRIALEAMSQKKNDTVVIAAPMGSMVKVVS